MCFTFNLRQSTFWLDFLGLRQGQRPSLFQFDNIRIEYIYIVYTLYSLPKWIDKYVENKFNSVEHKYL